MAAHTPTFSVHATLTADAADTVTWQGGTPTEFEVLNRSTTHTIYVRADGSGSAAVAAAEGTLAIPPGQGYLFDGLGAFSLISAGNADFSAHRVS